MNNKLFKFSIIFSVTAVTLCLSYQLLLLPSNAQLISQASSSIKPSPSASKELLNGVILAVVSGIIGFLANFVIERVKKKSEPRKQISYSQETKSGIVGEIEKDIEDKIGILYTEDQQKICFMLSLILRIQETNKLRIKR